METAAGSSSKCSESSKIVARVGFLLKTCLLLRTNGADEVLGCLRQEDYAGWAFVARAADLGAPHQRARVWIVAYDLRLWKQRRDGKGKRGLRAVHGDQQNRTIPFARLGDAEGDTGSQAALHGRSSQKKSGAQHASTSVGDSSSKRERESGNLSSSVASDRKTRKESRESSARVAHADGYALREQPGRSGGKGRSEETIELGGSRARATDLEHSDLQRRKGAGISPPEGRDDNQETQRASSIRTRGDGVGHAADAIGAGLEGQGNGAGSASSQFSESPGGRAATRGPITRFPKPPGCGQHSWEEPRISQSKVGLPTPGPTPDISGLTYDEAARMNLTPSHQARMKRLGLTASAYRAAQLRALGNGNPPICAFLFGVVIRTVDFMLRIGT